MNLSYLLGSGESNVCLIYNEFYSKNNLFQKENILMNKKIKKSLVAFSLIICVIMTLSITVGAIAFSEPSTLTINKHLAPILKDKAVAVPATPTGSYDSYSLYSKTTVTVYNAKSSETDQTNCYNQMYVLEGWSDYTKAVASIRAIKSANATFIVGSDWGSAKQIASW